MEKPSLGFQLKGSTKRQKIVTHESEAPAPVDLIKSISEGAAISVAPVKSKDLLVIPLIKNTNVPPLPVTGKEGMESITKEKPDVANLDMLAEKELLAELTGSNSAVTDSGLVIQQDNTNMLVRKKAPILAGSMDPALAAEMNEDERFKLDIQNRAEDISFKSDVYERIPISEYGAALLRGMGWEGTVEEVNNKKDDQKIVPREARLGLGATAKPPESKFKGKNGRPDERHSKAKDEWNKKIEEKIKSQRLQVDDLVWLRDIKYAGKRARVIQARGVPGLDKVRVQLESDATAVVDVNKRDAVLLSQDELSQKPYTGATIGGPESEGTKFFGLKEKETEYRDDQNREIERDKDEKKRKRSRSREKERDHHSSSHRHDKEDRERTSGRDRDSRRDDSRDRERNNRDDRRDREKDRDRERREDSRKPHLHSSSSGNSSSARYETVPSSSSSSSSAKMEVRVENWLCVGIRVKVISKSVNEGRAYRLKGTVVDVPAVGVCSLRLDSGRVVEGVKERQLETVLPAERGRCLILVGEWKGQEAVLLEKIEREEGSHMARVELSEELHQIIVSMDHIAAFEEA